MKCENEHEYEQGDQTGCPHLSFVRYCLHPHWLAKREPPCEMKRCGQELCHNFGVPFKNMERVFLVRQ